MSLTTLQFALNLQRESNRQSEVMPKEENINKTPVILRKHDIQTKASL